MFLTTRILILGLIKNVFKVLVYIVSIEAVFVVLAANHLGWTQEYSVVEHFFAIAATGCIALYAIKQICEDTDITLALRSLLVHTFIFSFAILLALYLFALLYLNLGPDLTWLSNHRPLKPIALVLIGFGYGFAFMASCLTLSSGGSGSAYPDCLKE